MRGPTSGSGDARASHPRERCWLAQRHSSPGPPAAWPPPAPPHVPLWPSMTRCDSASSGSASVWLTDASIMSLAPAPSSSDE